MRYVNPKYEICQRTFRLGCVRTRYATRSPDPYLDFSGNERKDGKVSGMDKKWDGMGGKEREEKWERKGEMCPV